MNNKTSYFYSRLSVSKKYFYVSLGNIFYCFVEAPLVVETLGNCPVCPPLNPAQIIKSDRYLLKGRAFYSPAITNKNNIDLTSKENYMHI